MRYQSRSIELTTVCCHFKESYLDDGSQIVDIIVSPTTQMEAKRPVRWHCRLLKFRKIIKILNNLLLFHPDDIPILLNDILCCGSSKQIQIDDASNGCITNGR